MDGETGTTEIRRYKFTVEQYHKMAEVGILAWGNREELIMGVVLDPSPLIRNRCHPSLNGGVTRFLNDLEGLSQEFEDRIHKYTAEEYQEMGRTGILTEEDRVELIDGEIVSMPPIGDEHQESVDEITELFVLTFSSVARVRVQGPVRLADTGEPEPDIMLLERRPGFYRSGHPLPHNVLLAVEVSDSTLRSDRAVKAPYYAHHEIPELWLLNLHDTQLEVYRNPSGGAYQEVTILRPGDTVSPQAFPEVSLNVSDLLQQ